MSYSDGGSAYSADTNYHVVYGGEVYAQYRVECRLGSGHFASVWLATDLLTMQYVAVKINKSEKHFRWAAEEELATCIEMERAREVGRGVSDRHAEASADRSAEDPSASPTPSEYLSDNSESENEVRSALSCLFGEVSPGEEPTVRLLDQVPLNGVNLMLVYELLGPTILDAIRRNRYGRAELSEARRAAVHALVALRFLHERCGYVHTDVKPENVCLGAPEAWLPAPRPPSPWTRRGLTDWSAFDWQSVPHWDLARLATRYYQDREDVKEGSLELCNKDSYRRSNATPEWYTNEVIKEQAPVPYMVVGGNAFAVVPAGEVAPQINVEVEVENRDKLLTLCAGYTAAGSVACSGAGAMIPGQILGAPNSASPDTNGVDTISTAGTNMANNAGKDNGHTSDGMVAGKIEALSKSDGHNENRDKTLQDVGAGAPDGAPSNGPADGANGMNPKARAIIKNCGQNGAYERVDIKELRDSLYKHPRRIWKLCDFGNAVRRDDARAEEIQTRQYRAPEVLVGARYDEGADVWSLACTLWELVTGEYLFNAEGPEHAEHHLALIHRALGPLPAGLVARGTHAPRFYRAGLLKNFPAAGAAGGASLGSAPLAARLVAHGLPGVDANALADFLLPMLAPDPTARASARAMLAHPWLRLRTPRDTMLYELARKPAAATRQWLQAVPPDVQLALDVLARPPPTLRPHTAHQDLAQENTSSSARAFNTLKAMWK